jgi:hypothetical protein
VVGLLQAVLHDQMEIVALVEDLASDVGVIFLELANLLVLFGHQLLVHRGDLHEQVVVGEKEVGCEELDGLTVFEVDREAPCLVLPRDPVEIEEQCELTLTVVGELDVLGGEDGCGQGAPTSTASANSASSGNNWRIAPST